MEIPEDLKRIAGVVNKYGWETNSVTGEQPLGGAVLLCGPVLVYQKEPFKYNLPGYYTKEEIDKAVEVMYESN